MNNEDRKCLTEDQLMQSTSVEHITARWCMLPPHVREAIVTLVDAGLVTNQHQRTSRVGEETNP